MSMFTKLPIQFYDVTAFDGFSLDREFRLGNAKAMAWLSQLAYETDEPKKIEDILGSWKLRLVDGVISAEIRTVLPMASTHGFVAAGRGATFITFAGTDPVVLANWISDFDTRLTSTGVAEGFAEAASIVLDRLKEILANSANAEQRLFLSGHSLGGALAVVAASRLTSNAPTAVDAVYTFGMPRPGSGDFARDYNTSLGTRTYRLVHGGDLVPTVAPSEMGFRHVGRYLHCARLGRFDEQALATDTVSDDPPFVQGIAGEIKDFLHSPLGAANAAAAQLRLAAEMALGRVPPGTRTDPGGILIELLPPRIRDHMPDRYCSALR
jgi:triacylglycerol lipase